MIFGNAIKQIIRERKGMTQITVAERLSDATGEVRDNKYVAVMLGKSRNPSINAAIQFAEAVDYEIVLRPRTGRVKEGEYLLTIPE